MIVVKVCMWPGGDASQERVLSVGTIACVGVARAADAARGIRAGERAYQMRLLKDTSFGGPDGADPEALHTAPVWRAGGVRGHLPGPRGAWDLLGGGLRVLLGARTNDYRGF